MRWNGELYARKPATSPLIADASNAGICLVRILLLQNLDAIVGLGTLGDARARACRHHQGRRE